MENEKPLLSFRAIRKKYMEDIEFVKSTESEKKEK